MIALRNGRKLAQLGCMALAVTMASAKAQTAGGSIGQAADLGAINRFHEISGQFLSGQRSHFYKFTLPTTDCVRVEALQATTKIQLVLRDPGGGKLGIAYRDSSPARGRHNTSLQIKLLSATYVVEVTLSRHSDTAGTYGVAISRGC